MGRMALTKNDALDAIEPIIGKGGIHDHRAGIIRCALVSGEEESRNERCEIRQDIGKSDAMAEF